MMKRSQFSTAALAALAFPFAAAAQETGTSGAAVASDELIVTAQRRAQNLQDVPLSVTALTGATLTLARINSVTDLQTATPGLNATTANRPATSTAFNLRGVGTSGSDPGLEAAVGFSVDGVYRARSGASLGDFVDVESVEVLRGPQGTLFGKNTTAGVIQVTTRDPDFSGNSGFVEGTYGNFNLFQFRGAANIALAPDSAALRLSVGYNKRDGFIEDPLAGADYNDRDRYALAAKLRLAINENTEALLVADYAEADESCCQSVRFTNGQTGGANSAYIAFLSARAAAHNSSYPVQPTPRTFVTSVNGPVENSNADSGLMLKVDADLGAASLTSITSYRWFSDFSGNDVDFTGADLVRQQVDLDLDVFSQELRLQGRSFSGRLDWLVGGFYSEESIAYAESIDMGVDANAYFASLSASLAGLYPTQTNAFGTRASQESRSVAFFTHNIISITDALRFTLGARWTTEEKDAVSQPYFNGPTAALPRAAIAPIGSPANAYALELSDSAVSGTAVLDYSWTDDIMTYVSYSRGYKAGGFGLGRDAAGPMFSRTASCAGGASPIVTSPFAVYRCNPVDPRFRPETVDSYEVGLRSQFFDRKLTFNLSLFDTEYTDLQLNTFTGTGFFLSNAGGAETRGVEAEIGLRVAEGVRVGANVGYLDTKYGDSVPAVVSGEPALGGQRLSNAPEWSGAANVSIDRPIADDLTFFARPEIYFRTSTIGGTRVSSSGAPLELPGYSLYNFAAGLRLFDRYELSAFCRNCSDKVYPVGVFTSVAQSGSKDIFLGNPAEFGLSLRADF